MKRTKFVKHTCEGFPSNIAYKDEMITHTCTYPHGHSCDVIIPLQQVAWGDNKNNDIYPAIQ